MKTKTVVTAEIDNVDKLQFGYDDGDGNWVAVDPFDAEDVKRAAKALGLTEEAVEAIAYSVNSAINQVVETVKADLKSIWDRI